MYEKYVEQYHVIYRSNTPPKQCFIEESFLDYESAKDLFDAREFSNHAYVLCNNVATVMEYQGWHVPSQAECDELLKKGGWVSLNFKFHVICRSEKGLTACIVEQSLPDYAPAKALFDSRKGNNIASCICDDLACIVESDGWYQMSPTQEECDELLPKQAARRAQQDAATTFKFHVIYRSNYGNRPCLLEKSFVDLESAKRLYDSRKGKWHAYCLCDEYAFIIETDGWKIPTQPECDKILPKEYENRSRHFSSFKD
jgi:hypothetical protein